MRFKIRTTAFLMMATLTVSAQSDVKDKFIAMLNGTESAAEKAIKAYCTSEIIENGMIPMGANPQITSKDENCYYFMLTDFDEPNHYFICSEGGKIVQFEWDLDKMDELEEEDEE